VEGVNNMSKDEEYVRLQVMPGEQRGDDLGSSIYPSFKSDDLTLLAFAYHTAPGGYVETICLKESSAQRLKEIRAFLEDPELKEILAKTLDETNVFPVPFIFFEKLSYYKKMDIVQAVNNKCRKEGEDLIQQKFDELYKMRKDNQKSIGSMVD